MRIGIYGGTFSPPHLGHLRAAEAFQKELFLDELIIIPTLIPPHKSFLSEASAQERLEMCRLTFGATRNARISDLEIKRGGKSYTYLTLEELYSPLDEFYMLIGTDMLLSLDTWRNPERIFELARVCYLRRESDPELERRIQEKLCFYKEKFGADILEIKADVTEISSTELRSLIERGESTERYILPSVREFIERRGLYR